jgi:hypothetical protein
VIEHRQSPVVATGCQRWPDSAQTDQCLSTRRIWTHASAEVVVDVQLDMAGELARELTIGAPLVAGNRSAALPPAPE